MNTKRPSRTARKVALNLVTLGARGATKDTLPPGSADATAELLENSGVAGELTIATSRSWLALGVYRALDWLMPGQFEAFAFRKTFCERQVRKGIEAGARQILVLGAGYDTLGWRLASEFSDVVFVEIDHTVTAESKIKGVAAMGPRPNLQIIAADLGQHSIVEVLTVNPSWNVDDYSVVVAEGLLMYLAPAAVGELFDHCAELVGPDSRMVFTYVGLRPDGHLDAGPWSPLVLKILDAAGEPWRWGIKPEQLGRFLAEHHWRLDPDLPYLSNRRGVEFFGMAVSRCPERCARAEASQTYS